MLISLFYRRLYRTVGLVQMLSRPRLHYLMIFENIEFSRKSKKFKQENKIRQENTYFEMSDSLL